MTLFRQKVFGAIRGFMAGIGMRCVGFFVLLTPTFTAYWRTDHFLDNLNFSENTFLRLAGVILLIAVNVAIGRWIWRAHKFACTRKWWDIGKKSDDLSWEDVRLMAIGNGIRDQSVDAYDPLSYGKPKHEKRDKGLFSPSVYMLIGFLAQGCLTAFFSQIIYKNEMLPFFLTDYADTLKPEIKVGANVVMNLSANLTAFLALLAAAVSIYFTHRQLQAKVKADSRQAWIDKLRARIARTISLADMVRYANDKSCSDDIHQKMFESRLEMELMLNPSEKDHRMLMFLVQKLTLFGDKDGIVPIRLSQTPARCSVAP